MQVIHSTVASTLPGKKNLQQKCYKGPSASLVWAWQTITSIKTCSLHIWHPFRLQPHTLFTSKHPQRACTFRILPHL